MKFLLDRLQSWLPRLPSQAWILVGGRLLSGIGTGFTLFYAPIFFVNEIGLSKAAVGLAVGSASLSGILGRIISGFLLDSPKWGRKKTLFLSGIVEALASTGLAVSSTFEMLVLGNLLMGLGMGLYWPTTDSFVADLTTGGQRHDAYAMTRMGDSFGLQLGVIFGGLVVSQTGAYRLLFIIDASSFLVFSVIVWVAITEPERHLAHTGKALAGWATALRDRLLLVYVAVNIFFTVYMAQIQTTMPLYFTEFVKTGEKGEGFSPATISTLFSWHLVLLVLLQLPVARLLKHFTHPQALIISGLLWGVGFIFIGLTSILSTSQFVTAAIGLGFLALAIVAYSPSASSLVAEIAPIPLRGVYLSIDSQCWAVGYFIGPILGGWVLDLPRPFSDKLWLGLVMSVVIVIGVLQNLDRLLRQRKYLDAAQSKNI